MRYTHQRCIRMRWNHEQEIMGRTLGAGPSIGHPFLCVKLLCAQSLWHTHRGVDANFVESRYPQFKGSTNCPRRVSLNTVSTRTEEFIEYL